MFCRADLICLALSAAGEIAVTAALLHVMIPHQVELLLTVAPHTLVSLRTHGQELLTCAYLTVTVKYFDLGLEF